MTQSPDGTATPEKKYFFISRAGADTRWAELIASVVRDAGHEPIYQDEHFHVGESFVDNMATAAEADCTIAVFSPAYFKSEHCLAELDAAIAADPLGRRHRVIPVLVDRAEIPTLFGHLAYLDLVGADDETARQRLMKTLIRHGQIDSSKLALAGRTRHEAQEANRNRTAMIEKVRTIWIKGFLEKSLYNEVRIVLGLAERPSAVASPFHLLVQRPDEGERKLPPRTRVLDLYDDSCESLLILGEPGSGKTTLLLELARDLLDRADRDSTRPIPVVFPLSTWAASRKNLAEWIKDELSLRYDVPRKIALEWIVSERIMPLLDGLDEVKEEHRDKCVDAINEFRQSCGFLPIVVASRTTEYGKLAEPLRLQGAIRVQPLTHDHVQAYLDDLGEAGSSVRAALEQDSSLSSLIDTPLLLNVVAAALLPVALPRVPTTGPVEKRRDLCFESYVKQMLRRRAAVAGHTPEQAVHWLSWLASQMMSHGDTVFYLERMQWSWIPTSRRRAIGMSAVVTFSTLIGVGLALLWSVFFAIELGGPAGLQGRPLYRLIGFSVTSVPLVSGISGWWLCNVISPVGKEIVCVEKVTWSWARLLASFRSVLKTGLVIGLALAPAVGLSLAKTEPLAKALSMGIRVFVLSGSIAAFVHGLIAGMKIREIDTITAPNSGIHRSATNALSVGLVVCLIVSIFVLMSRRLYSLLEHGLSRGLTRSFTLRELVSGLVLGLVAGLVVGLIAGGLACFRHVRLRYWLIRAGTTPRNYVKFLDDAVERILLRKVGGGYMFIHRMLMEWFAARYVDPEAKPAGSAAPSVSD
jgi:hypothetical protein